MNRKHRLAATTCAGALALGSLASSGAAQDPALQRAIEKRAATTPSLGAVERTAERFERSIDVHRLESRASTLSKRAARLGAAPRRERADRAPATLGELRERVERLERIVRRAEREAAEPEFPSVAGVSPATLEAIAACESGGDPEAVNPAGYYGKYQFDPGTWASVGGSGNPAQAPEAEQDYRAALLLSRAGASPWPVCGA